MGGRDEDELPAVDPTGREVPDDAGTPPTSLVRQVLTGTDRVEDLLARAAVAAHARGAAEHASRVHAAGTDIGPEVRRTVQQHTRMARAQGATAGAAITALEMTSVWGSAGTLTIPAATTGLAADLTSLAWVQARMVMHLAALRGLDPYDGPARVRDLLTLWGIDDLGELGLGDVVAGSRTAWTRQAVRRVTSPGARLRALLRMVGLRSIGKRMVPLLNVPLTSAANARTTAALGNDAMRHFWAPDPSDGAGRI